MPWLLTDRIPFYLNCNAYREIPSVSGKFLSSFTDELFGSAEGDKKKEEKEGKGKKRKYGGS